MWTSAFGHKKNNKWSLTSNGSLINTADLSNRYRVYHPHSALSYQGNFYYCESWTGSVFRNNIRIKQIEGSYVRGLDIDSDTMIVGLNSGRSRSKSRGVLNDLGQVSKFSFYSGILLLNRKRNTESYFDLSEYSRDIYEYTREIYAIKLVKNITLDNLRNIASHSQISSTKTIKVNPFASLLLNENQNLRIKLSKSIKQRNHLIDKIDTLRRDFRMINKVAQSSFHEYTTSSNLESKKLFNHGSKVSCFLRRIVRGALQSLLILFLFDTDNLLMTAVSYLSN